ncbi:replication factor C large subunit [Candidatus Micrarchaeota archaeon]|nr:replication factor C large subunit [Candidatus Micrarchaeota archaeon]
MLFTQKYSPLSLGELAGNEEAFSKMRRWAYTWEKSQHPGPLLLHGPCGSGKTSSVHALAREFGWELLELNSTADRSSASIGALLGPASLSSGLFGAKKLLLIDDADFAAAEDRGAVSALAKIAGACQQPLIITATDAYSKNLSLLRGMCEKIELKKVNVHATLSLLKRVCAAERIQLDDAQLHLLAQNSQGDVRAALNDLQARNFSPNSRERERNVFETVRGILKGTSYSDCRPLLMSCGLPHDTLKLWIAENVPVEYEKPAELAAAFSMLSRADIFDGRISNRQYWGFLRYSTALMGAGVALSKQSPYGKFASYSYPSFIRVMGATKEKRAIKKSLARKASSAFHCPLWAFSEYLPLLSKLAHLDPQGTLAAYSLEIAELAFLLGTTVEKTQKLLGLGSGKNKAVEKEPAQKHGAKKPKIVLPAEKASATTRGSPLQKTPPANAAAADPAHTKENAAAGKRAKSEPASSNRRKIPLQPPPTGRQSTLDFG